MIDGDFSNNEMLDKINTLDLNIYISAVVDDVCVPGGRVCGRVSVVDEDLLAPRHGLQRLDAEARQPEHRVLHPPETAVGLETVVGLQIFLLWFKYFCEMSSTTL